MRLLLGLLRSYKGLKLLGLGAVAVALLSLLRSYKGLKPGFPSELIVRSMRLLRSYRGLKQGLGDKGFMGGDKMKRPQRRNTGEFA